MMKVFGLVLALITTPVAAEVRQERLTGPTSVESGGRIVSCTEDREWCVTMAFETDPDKLAYFVDVKRPIGPSSSASIENFELSSSDGAELWGDPVSYSTPNGQRGLLFGIVMNRSESYSGGGASERKLQFFKAEPKDANILSVSSIGDPISFGASSMIRACFSEEDQQLRRNICHDEYDLNVTLRLKPTLVNDLPAFLYISKATTTPGFASRDQDNSDAARLRTMKAADFKPRTDRRCTFTRQLQVNARRTIYSLKVPDCSAYGPMRQ